MSELNYTEEDEYKEEEDQPVGSGTGSPCIFTANIRASMVSTSNNPHCCMHVASRDQSPMNESIVLCRNTV
jgi:hypothetical protein